MAFTEVTAGSTISLGGINKKTGKPNPTSVEGYYLGSRQTPDKLKKNGFEYIHSLQTAKGIVDVWGKTDLNMKLLKIIAGTMVRVSHTGTTRPTPKGDMQVYKVEADTANTIAVATENGDLNAGSAGYGEDENGDNGEDDEDDGAALDEAPVARASAPRNPARTPDAAAQAKARALLNGTTRKTG